MAREDVDGGSHWLIRHLGGAIFQLAELPPVESWEVRTGEVVVPKRRADGLVDVKFVGRPEPVPVVIEVATYPERRVSDQILRDTMLVYLERGVMPEAIVVVLRPKGRYRVEPYHEVASPLGMTNWQVRWRVVEMWEVPAEMLFASGDVGLMPWVPLSQFDEPAEVVLRRCRERIDRASPESRRESMLVVTQVMTRLRFGTGELMDLFQGKHRMFELPFMDELKAQARDEYAAHRYHNTILRFLTRRFGPVPEDLEAAIRDNWNLKTVESWLDYSVECPELDAFRARISAPAE